MTARLGVVIESTLGVPGVVAAVLANATGHAIEGAARTEGDLATAARSASEVLHQWASAGTELGMGDVRALLLERSGGPVVVLPAPHGGAFMVVGDQTCRPGRLRHDAWLAREAVVEVVRTASAPAGRGGDAVQGIGEARQPSGRLTAGEIVLVGAHTFRFVTKLVARLLQANGVRSSRLRAYSPASTVIDVELEEGTTLAEIGRGCLGDFSVERAAGGHNRLVLRAAKPFVREATPIGSPG